MENLENIVSKLMERIESSNKTLSELRQEKEKVFDEYDKNLQREKEYFNKVKLFEAECDKNELLMQQVKEIKLAKRQNESTA
jgi:hypothetical protein